MIQNCPVKKSRTRGFTLIELLVVIAIIAILAAMLLPTLAAAKRKASTAACLNSQKELALGWKMFPDDHDNYIVSGGVGSSTAGSVSTTDDLYDWRMLPSGVATADPTVPTSPGPAESVVFYDDWGFKVGALWGGGNYVRDANVIHCPSDQRYTSGNPAWCSYSMPENLNGHNASAAGATKDYRIHKDFQIKHPSNMMLWTEENDPRLDPPGPDGKQNEENAGSWEPFKPGGAAGGDAPQPNAFTSMAAGGTIGWYDGPTTFHVASSTFSFADGHCEAHRWIDDAITFAVNPVAFRAANGSAHPSKDSAWLYTHYCTTINQ